MIRKSKSELKPRNGHSLITAVVARISGCPNQKEMSLEDQVDHGHEIVDERYEGPAEYRVIATKGKGERLDRPELAEIEAMIRTRELDLLVMEDVGRLIRGAEAVKLWGIAVDYGTRCIAPNDCCDTADETWEEDLMTACRDHVGHNSHTSKRIKHKKMNRFKKFGGATPCEVFGYFKPDGAKTYADWQRVDSATPIIREGLSRLGATLNSSAVADWFNQQGVPVGDYCRRRTWNGPMVRRFYRNPILKGQPGRGFRHTVKHYETGRRVSVKNPTGPIYRDEPHLAHVDPTEFNEVNARLDAKNAGVGRKPVNGVDPRLQVPRKRTKFPGQHGCCWYCGRQDVWGGNGISANLMCNGSRDWLCWNSVGYSGELAVERLVQTISGELYGLSGFDQQYREIVQRARLNAGGGLDGRRNQLRHDEESLEIRKGNVKAVIDELGMQPLLNEMLEGIKAEEIRIAAQRQALEQLEDRTPVLPDSTADLRTMFETSQRKLAKDSPEFGGLMRNLVPDFHVYLVRLCDGGHLLPRARVRLALDGIIPDARLVPALTPLLTRTVTIDLFEPPQRERIREQAVQFAADGLGPKAIAQRISERPTTTAVQNALALQRKMEELGLTSPYVTMLKPPEDYPKLRRHKNGKYRFKRLDGYQPPSL
jgi:site-specific DNA recombinase